MNKVDLEEFQKLRKTFEKKPLKDNKDLLYRVGLYYRITIPSEIDLGHIKETERFLNDLYVKSTTEFITSEVQKSLSNTLGIASSISYAVKIKNFDPDFFVRVKNLSEALISISYSI
jgi:hypothetical protein